MYEELDIAQVIEAGRIASSENKPPEDNPYHHGDAPYFAWMVGYAQGQVEVWNANVLAFTKKTLELTGGASIPKPETGDDLDKLTTSDLLIVLMAESSRLEAMMHARGTDVRFTGTVSMLFAKAGKAIQDKDPSLVAETIRNMRKVF